MTPIKVEKTEIFKDATGDHIVCRGKLILVECKSNVVNCVRTISFVDQYHYPIIISETEDIEVGDSFELNEEVHVLENKSDLKILNQQHEVTFKVLALPEHFSQEHLQFIAEGKLNHQDYVIVECWNEPIGFSYNETIYSKRVKLTDGHIKLLPFKWINNKHFVFYTPTGKDGFSKTDLGDVVMHFKSCKEFNEDPNAGAYANPGARIK